MPTEVKICGLSEEESVDAALEAGADFVGFVFFRPSPRYIPIDRAAALAARACGKAGIVALTVDADDPLLADIAEGLRPDLLQLHGNETPARAAAVRDLTGLPIMKAIGVAQAADLARTEDYPAADRFLLDAKPPKDATRPGGNAAAFDWRMLDGFSSPKPWLLAGGLDPANVASALAATGAPGVDVSSGVERAPGQKDTALIRAFVRAVRDFDRAAERMAS
jgi:phosphoribosylanthranilate isomerase